MVDFPIYLRALREGIFERKMESARALLQECRVCPRICRVNRIADERGECQIGLHPIISSYFPHFGEEAPLVGYKGSGTIFMAGCNLRCLFCQNYDISHLVAGKTVPIERFSEMMLELQEMGCHNINIVTPTHIVPQLVEAIYFAAKNGLRLPIVYNSSGYDSISILKILDGIIDIYMPDFKFFDDAVASRYTDVSDYAKVAKIALKEMHRQVGDLSIENGIARRGLLVRHLVMPNMLENSEKIFQYIAKEISLNTYLNIMPQYRPAGEASLHSEIAQSLKYTEFTSALNYAKSLGLNRLDKDF